MSKTASAPVTPFDLLRGDDYISALHEYAAYYRFIVAEPKFKQKGPDHRPTFTCTLSIEMAKKHTGIGTSSIKKHAKQMAAQALCEEIKKLKKA